jgi:hypothetical protein
MKLIKIWGQNHKIKTTHNCVSLEEIDSDGKCNQIFHVEQIEKSELNYIDNDK